MKELYQKDKSGAYIPVLESGLPIPSLDWQATELIVGAKVRTTIRNGTCVRLEVRKKPSREQRISGIISSWYREVSEDAYNADVWLWEAAERTGFSSVPDGEWNGVAIGPKIAGNPYGLYQSKVILTGLMPWKERLASIAPIAPSFDRCPIEFSEFFEWASARKSLVNKEVELKGIVWWYLDAPVAKVVLNGQ